jgi:CBS domain-containing protein
MSSPSVTLSTGETLYRAQQLFEQHSLGALPVVGPSGELLGLLSRDELREAQRAFPLGMVSDARIDPGECINLDASAREALVRLHRSAASALLVVEDGLLIGMLTPMDLALAALEQGFCDLHPPMAQELEDEARLLAA